MRMWNSLGPEDDPSPRELWFLIGLILLTVVVAWAST